MSDLDLPYESQEPTPLADNPLYAGGVVIMGGSSSEPWDGGRKFPVLVFRFALPDGSGKFYLPVALVLTDEQMGKLQPLITTAIHDAREAAKR